MAKIEKVESKELGSDRQIFPRVLMWTGIALLVILIAAVFLARPAAKMIQPVNPPPHSELWAPDTQQAV